MKKPLLTLALVLLAALTSVAAEPTFPQLSDQARISLLTFTPGQELYTNFGHTALRVTDPTRGMDLVFNWGLFDFNQPGFYTNFLFGKLDYQLGSASYRAYYSYHASINRGIREVGLNLDPAARQRLFELIATNDLPQNRHYFYDFFYDNCATRPRDLLEKTLGSSLIYPTMMELEDKTFRDLLDLYLPPQDWAHFGINVVLGLPVDKKIGLREAMFLPDYVEKALAGSQVSTTAGTHPLSDGIQVLYQNKPDREVLAWWLSPWLLWLAPVLAGPIFWLEFKSRRPLPWLDVPLFAISGLFGLLLTFLWLFTDHVKVVAPNFNLVWILPLNLPIAFFLLGRSRPLWLRGWFLLNAGLISLFLVSWPWLPQRFDLFQLPLVLTLAARSWAIGLSKA